MSKKKMCPHYRYPDPCKRGNDGLLKCPRNANLSCEIIPKKPKMVRVKAWALKGNHKYCCPVKYENFNIPCTILIDEKYLRRKP